MWPLLGVLAMGALAFLAGRAWRKHRATRITQYLGFRSGAPTLTLVRRSAPQADHTLLGWIALPLAEPGPMGVGTDDERHHADTLLQDLAKALAPSGGKLLGRMCTKGSWQAYFALTEAEAFQEQAVQHFAAFQSLRMGSSHRANLLRFFQDELLPTPAEETWLHDAKALEAVHDSGITPTSTQPVEHRVSFPTKGQRSDFLIDILRLGFEARLTSHRGEPTALLTREETMDVGQLLEVRQVLSDRAEAFNGRYTGWRFPDADV